MKLFSSRLGPAGKIFISYEGDLETSVCLNQSVPPSATRLGYKLLKLGFTWFNDWYFPEGGSEGTQKLQGEKPVDKKAEDRQMREIKKDLTEFLNRYDFSNIKKPDSQIQLYINRAITRAEEIKTNY